LVFGVGESAKERIGSARKLMGVCCAIDGRGAARMARHLEALHNESRGGIAGCVVRWTFRYLMELKIIRIWWFGYLA
jgi:hypothetical protein